MIQSKRGDPSHLGCVEEAHKEFLLLFHTNDDGGDFNNLIKFCAGRVLTKLYCW